MQARLKIAQGHYDHARASVNAASAAWEKGGMETLKNTKGVSPEGGFGLTFTNSAPFSVVSVERVLDEELVAQGEEAYGNAVVRVGDRIVGVGGENVEVTDKRCAELGMVTAPVHSVLVLEVCVCVRERERERERFIRNNHHSVCVRVCVRVCVYV